MAFIDLFLIADAHFTNKKRIPARCHKSTLPEPFTIKFPVHMIQQVF
jgi:hypothetical protein